MWERIPAESWRAETGHVDRYEMAASLLLPNEVVLDAACGVGYGSQVLTESGWTGTVHKADMPGVHDSRFAGTVHEVDLNSWKPSFEFDVAICFETLEHLTDPQAWADQISRATRLVIVSVPTISTKHFNPWHLHDFTADEVPDLFPALRLTSVTAQPSEFSHIFTFTH